jgi:TRAP-type mannitol/chloroaromatic compound transport system permease large subunit
MQTSFMHPPFGFALFFCARWPAKEYEDRSPRNDPARHHHADLLGRRPFVVIQLVMVG